MHPNSPIDPQSHPHARWNLVFAYLSLFYFGLCDNIRGPLYPEIVQTFGVSHAMGGWFFALASLANMLGGAMVVGFFARWGYLTLFRVSLLMLVLSQAMYAVSPSFAFLLFGALVMGFGFGALSIMQNVLVMVATPPARLGLAMNGLHANYGAASLLAPLLVAFCYFVRPQMSFVFWATAVIGACFFVSTFLIPGFVESRQKQATRPEKGPLQLRMFLLAGALGSYVVAEIALGTRMAQFVRETRGSDMQEASLWTTLFFVGLFLSRLVFTFVSLRTSVRKQLFVALALSLLLSVAGLLLSPWFFFLAGIAMGPCYPLGMAILRMRFPHQLEKATTITISISGLLVVSLHLLAGLVTDQFGITWALLLGPLFCLLALVLLWFEES